MEKCSLNAFAKSVVLLLRDVSSFIVCQVRHESFLCSVNDFVIRFLCHLDVTVNFVAKSFKFTPILWVLLTYCFQLHDVSFISSAII